MALVNSNINRISGKFHFQKTQETKFYNNCTIIPHYTEEKNSFENIMQQSCTKINIDTESVAKKRKSEILTEMSKQRKNQELITDDHVILEYDIDPYQFREQDESILIDYSVEMFKHYNLLTEFNIKEDALRTFFAEVRQRYNHENQFHNFKHVWCVMHLSFQIMLRGADKYLKPLDIFAVLVAAICHDMAHPGNSNAFELATQSDISKMYADPPDEICVLERYHATLTKGLLTNECGQEILKGLSKPTKEVFYNHVFQIIMATDMAKHKELVKEAEAYTVAVSPSQAAHKDLTPAATNVENGKAVATVTPRSSLRIAAKLASLNKNDADSRLKFTRIIVHSADIGAQTQCTKIAGKWVDRCYDEFRSQASKEKTLGIVTSPFLHEISVESKKYADQIGFIAGVIEPMWKALTDLLPDLRFAYLQLIANKAMYREQVGRESDKEERERLSSSSGDGSPAIESFSSQSSDANDTHMDVHQE